MIKVIVSMDKEGAYRGIKLSGHALFSEYGKDIVCAAVSVLTLNTLNAIEVFCKETVEIREDAERGFLEAGFPEKLSEKAVLLLDAMMLGLDGISDEYGKKYITITRQEV